MRQSPKSRPLSGFKDLTFVHSTNTHKVRTNMTTSINIVNPSSEERIAHLTDVAYQAILERGFRGSFLDLELSLWNAIRASVEQSIPKRTLETA